MTITIRDLQGWKAEGKADAAAYDFPTAKIFDEAGIPVLLVGDSVGNTILGYENTAAGDHGRDAAPHARGCARRYERAGGGRHAVFQDQGQRRGGVHNAGRFLKEEALAPSRSRARRSSWCTRHRGASGSP